MPMMMIMMAMQLGEKETREAVGDNLMRTIMVKCSYHDRHNPRDRRYHHNDDDDDEEVQMTLRKVTFGEGMWFKIKI